MQTLGTRRLILGAVAFAAIGLLAEPALADKAMFRVQFKAWGAGGQSTFQSFHPPVTGPACGQGGTMGTLATCAGASVGTTTPAAKFTIPPYAITTAFTYSYTGYAGYTSLTTATYWNGRGRFFPNNPDAVPGDYFRFVFPTTGGNTGKNKASGYPVTPTTTFDGAFDKYRAGSIQVTPGPNRFGGTIQYLYSPDSLYKQKIRTQTGYYSRATGDYNCQATKGSVFNRDGPLQYCTLSGTSKVGQLASSGIVVRKKYTSLGYVPIKTTMGVNNLTYRAYYLFSLVPYTTGMVFAQNPLNYKNQKFTTTGYDKQFSPPTSRTAMYYNYNTTAKGTTTTTTTRTVKGITRITSMVRPRLRHSYLKSNEPTGTISTPYQSARIAGINVMFLPEPSGMLLMGAGMLGVGGLALLRRR